MKNLLQTLVDIFSRMPEQVRQPPEAPIILIPRPATQTQILAKSTYHCWEEGIASAIAEKQSAMAFIARTASSIVILILI
jgi:hypothetical protein